jgi:hypothetical protein
VLITVLLPSDPRRWHQRFLSVLGSSEYELQLLDSGYRTSLPVGLGLLLMLERLLVRAGDDVFEPVDLAMAEGPPKGEFIINLSGFTAATGSAPRLSPLFDRCRDPNTAIAALLDGRAPRLEIEFRDAMGARIVASGLPAVENRYSLSRSLQKIFARSASLLLRALRDFQRGRILSGAAESAIACVPAPPLFLFPFVVRALASKIANRLTRIARLSDHWVVGYRLGRANKLWDRFEWEAPNSLFRLPDDGARFYADPFVLRHDGTFHVFVEEYPYSTGKGVVSWFTIDNAGKASAPRVVLERPYHLSYPFVFEHGGHIYMIPETHKARRVEIYRADLFPHRWVFDGILIDDIEATDATLVADCGRLWLFAAVADAGGSTWDSLCLFWSDKLLNKWRPHGRNPVLVDSHAARPAGAMIRKNGGLWRVAQDCSRIYGGGLAFCAIDRLDDEDYAQSVVKTLAPPPSVRARGVHTLNCAGALEVFDLIVPLRTAGMLPGEGIV